MEKTLHTPYNIFGDMYQKKQSLQENSKHQNILRMICCTNHFPNWKKIILKFLILLLLKKKDIWYVPQRKKNSWEN